MSLLRIVCKGEYYFCFSEWSPSVGRHPPNIRNTPLLDYLPFHNWWWPPISLRLDTTRVFFLINPLVSHKPILSNVHVNIIIIAINPNDIIAIGAAYRCTYAITHNSVIIFLTIFLAIKQGVWLFLVNSLVSHALCQNVCLNKDFKTNKEWGVWLWL